MDETLLKGARSLFVGVVGKDPFEDNRRLARIKPSEPLVLWWFVVLPHFPSRRGYNRKLLIFSY